MPEFLVGVFEHPRKRSIQLAAYTVWYNRNWSGCCEHRVEAKNGTDAKRIAMADHRARCMEGKGEA